MMKDDGTSIRSLPLEFFDPLSELEPKYLFAAFEKFEAVEFWDCEDAPRDVMTTFFKTVAASTNLKKLLLTCVHNFSHVDHTLLRRMATQLEELYLGGGCDEGDCDMTNQIGTIIDAIASDEVATLKKLTLHYIDLSLVDGHLLGRMATQVKELDVTSDDLDKYQLNAIFVAIAAGPGELKKLQIESCSKDFKDEVSDTVLAAAVNKLECFYNAGDSDLFSIRSLKTILKKALKQTSLKTLVFQGDKTLLDPKLIRAAEKIIPNLSIQK